MNTIVVFFLFFALSLKFDYLTTKYILVGIEMKRPEHNALKSWESLPNLEIENRVSDVETGTI